jgi:hypothetical protein
LDFRVCRVRDSGSRGGTCLGRSSGIAIICCRGVVRLVGLVCGVVTLRCGCRFASAAAAGNSSQSAERRARVALWVVGHRREVRRSKPSPHAFDVLDLLLRV